MFLTILIVLIIALPFVIMFLAAFSKGENPIDKYLKK